MFVAAPGCCGRVRLRTAVTEYVCAIRFASNWSQTGHRFPVTSRERKGTSGTAGTSLQVQERTAARDGKGREGTKALRLLPARLWVRVPPPEPVQLLRDSESGTQSDSGGGFGSHLGVSGRTSEAVKAALQ